MTATPADFEQAAWSWVSHLRAGGSTPWTQWAARAARPQEPARVGVLLPGAAELELVRRLAVRSTLAPPAFAALADLALARSGPGRGLPQLPLRWPYGDRGSPDAARPGALPTDPADVPAEELVRVGTGVLAELLAHVAPADPQPVRRRPWTRSFRLLGAPVTTAGVRARLAAAGHVEGGRRPEVVLIAAPFDALLAQVWSARVQRGAPVRWGPFVDRWARRDHLPPALRLPDLAERWGARVGAGKVHVVVAEDPAVARRTVADVLRLRGREPDDLLEPDRARLHDLSLPATDLLRRLNPVLSVRLPAERAEAARVAAARVLDRGQAPAPGLPERHREWAAATADRLADRLRAGGYPVHGDLHGLAVRPRSGPVRPRHRDELALVLDACLALAGRAPGQQEAQ